jgi:hypothetical protein
MYCRRLFSALAVMFMCFWASASFAINPTLCDPEEDPDACECSPNIDTCHEVVPNDLISPDDPLVLREVANITSYWDKDLEAYVVQADTTGLTAAGIMKLNSNRGQWESREELFSYIDGLIGQNSIEGMCEIPGKILPPFILEQTGITARYNQFDEKWAEAHSGNIIFDAISDEHGDVYVNGIGLDIFMPGSDCAGTAERSYDSAQGNDVAAQQCSSLSRSQSHTCYSPPPGSENCQTDCETLTSYTVSTVLETADIFERIGGTIRCRAERFDGKLECDLQGSLIIHERVAAEYLEIRSHFFLSSNAAAVPTDPKIAQDEMDVVHSSNIYDGVCAYGTVEEGETQLNLFTQDGEYDWSDVNCEGP